MEQSTRPSPDAARRAPEPPFLFVLILCAAVAATMFALAFAAPDVPPVLGLDFRAFYTAGRIVLDGGPLYDFTHQLAVQKSVWPTLNSPDDLLSFINPPFVALPMALVAWLPPVPAFALWTLFETLWLAVLLRVLVVQLPPVPRVRLAFLFLSLTFLPALLVFLHGQLTFLLALPLLLAWNSFREETARGDFRGGAWLALLAVKPQLLLVPLLWLAFKQRGRALLGAVTMLAALGAVSLAMVGLHGLLALEALLRRAASWSGAFIGIHPQQMHSWRGLVAWLLPAGSPAAQTLWLLGVLLAVGLLLFSWRGAWQPRTPRSDLAFAQLILTVTFCSAHLNPHDLALWIVAGALLGRAVYTSMACDGRGGRLLRSLPWLGYATAWLWFVLKLSNVPLAPLTIFFQIFALGVLTWHLAERAKPALPPVPVAGAVAGTVAGAR